MQSDLVCGKQFLGQISDFIDQHLVLVWADLHLFLAILQQYLGEIFSVQRCSAPNAPKISILIFRICIKLNLGFILAIL